MDLAEDRDRFNRLMDQRGIAQPEGGSATSEAEALELANDIGYPVLVRPSYVLGGRAMDVVYNDDDLKEYIEEAVRVSPDKPILIDEFLDDAVELDVDAVADGEDVIIGGVMEHVESAGVHSGDSACMIPPQADEVTEVMDRVREVTVEIARELDTVGLLNVQLAVKDGTVYVLEANPRSSRTVPFVSKATGVPIAKLAAKVMAGHSLDELDAQEQIPEKVSVKEVVLPFDRLPGSDPRLGPEMKSTGEVMGTAEHFGKAYEKAQSATGKAIPSEGTAVVDLSASEFPDPDSEAGQALIDAFAEFYDVTEFDDLSEAIRRGEVDVIVSRNREALEVAVEEDITYFSTHASAEAVLEGLRHQDDPIDVQATSDRPKVRKQWGE
jgi:carbamoyl-phosphate synthase large subunit